jgi:hypothetical protein
MINPNSEALTSLADAARTLPRRRGGKKPHVSCIYRWTTSGCRGVTLESIQIGGTRCTSNEALNRFFTRLTRATNPEAPPTGTPARRRRAAASAEQQLQREGV